MNLVALRPVCSYWTGTVHENGSDCITCTACWHCGWPSPLQRCHIIADALGGEDTPSNLVLLCARCHHDAPDVLDPDEMWRWLEAEEPAWMAVLRGVAPSIVNADLTDEEADLVMNRAEWLTYQATIPHGGGTWSTRSWVIRTAVHLVLAQRHGAATTGA